MSPFPACLYSSEHYLLSVWESPDLTQAAEKKCTQKSQARAPKEKDLRSKVGELQLWGIQSGAEPGDPDVRP